MILTLDLPFPISANDMLAYSRKSGPRRSEAYAKYRRDTAWSAIAQAKRRKIIGDYRMLIEAVPRASGSRLDIDNAIKPLSDALQESGVIQNDSLAVEIRIVWSQHQTEPGVRVTLVEAEYRLPSIPNLDNLFPNAPTLCADGS